LSATNPGPQLQLQKAFNAEDAEDEGATAAEDAEEKKQEQLHEPSRHAIIDHVSAQEICVVLRVPLRLLPFLLCALCVKIAVP
jgi:hypothetical protein